MLPRIVTHTFCVLPIDIAYPSTHNISMNRLNEDRRAAVVAALCEGVSVSVERSNLTVRMHTRRFTRLTNGFSKKLDNHKHSLALFFMYYNFVRVHQTLRVTPAMEAGVTNHIWTVEEIVSLVPELEVPVILK